MAKYGFPFKGFNGVLDRWLLPPNFIGDDSHDVVLNPLAGSWVRRRGSVIQGDTVDGTTAAAGVLEAKWSANSTQMFSLKSASLEENTSADDYPTYAVYYGNEATKQGQLYLRSSDTSLSTANRNYSYGWEFGTTHYRQDSSGSGSSSWNLHWIPMWYDSGNGGMTRGATKLTRRYLMSGSRKGIDVGRELCMPNFTGTPTRWMRRFNEVSNTGSEKNQLYPIGHIPGMGIPTLADTDTPNTGTDVGPWQKNNVFFYGYAFVDENDAVSMPLLPRNINVSLPSGFGKFTVTSAGDYVEFITWSNIPLGPPGTKARLLLRTPVKGDKTTAAIVDPDISDLRVTAILENNSQRTFVDTNGNDGSLVADPTRIRYDHRWMPPSRYMWASDHHVICGYLAPHPGALIVAPFTNAATGDVANDVFDTGANHPFGNSVIYIARIYNDNLELANSAGDAFGGSRELIDISSGTGNDLQTVIDLVNVNYARASGVRGYVAQQVPGADVFAGASNLLPTYFTIAACTYSDANTTMTTSNSFANVAVGMEVSGHAEIEGLYVASIESNTSLTLSATPSGAVGSPVTAGFSFDFGDDGFASAEGADADKWGWMRCFAPAWPGVFYWANSYLDDFEDDRKSGSKDKRSIIFSGGEPGHAVNAVNNFYVGNKRTGLAEWGTLMGGAPVEIGSLVYYTDAVAKFRNIRGGKTGRDEDFRLESHDEKGSCISPYSIAFGNGWVVALERNGLVARVANIKEGIVLSTDIVTKDENGDYHGEWAFEMNKCVAAADSDADDFGFRCAVLGSQIHVTYRVALNTRRRMVYDFSASVSASGIRQILDTDGKPYGWSSPLEQNIVDMIEVTKLDEDSTAGSARIRRYGTLDDNNGSLGDGRVDEFDRGDDDNGADLASRIRLATDFVGSFDLKSPQWAKILYNKSVSGMTLGLSRDLLRSTTDLKTLAAVTGAFKKKTLNLSQEMRIPREVVEFRIDDDGTGAPYEFWGIEAEIEVLDSAGV